MGAVILLKFSCHSHRQRNLSLFPKELKIIQDIYPNSVLNGKIPLYSHNLYGLDFRIKIRQLKATSFTLPFNFIPFSFPHKRIHAFCNYSKLIYFAYIFIISKA